MYSRIDLLSEIASTEEFVGDMDGEPQAVLQVHVRIRGVIDTQILGAK